VLYISGNYLRISQVITSGEIRHAPATAGSNDRYRDSTAHTPASRHRLGLHLRDARVAQSLTHAELTDIPQADISHIELDYNPTESSAA
jgi:hypothetical protein